MLQPLTNVRTKKSPILKGAVEFTAKEYALTTLMRAENIEGLHNNRHPLLAAPGSQHDNLHIRLVSDPTKHVKGKLHSIVDKGFPVYKELSRVRSMSRSSPTLQPYSEAPLQPALSLAKELFPNQSIL